VPAGSRDPASSSPTDGQAVTAATGLRKYPSIRSATCLQRWTLRAGAGLCNANERSMMLTESNHGPSPRAAARLTRITIAVDSQVADPGKVYECLGQSPATAICALATSPTSTSFFRRFALP
jgi:hypothetical protein